MPKIIDSKSLTKIMRVCMTDEQTKKEYPDPQKRRQVCYAAAQQKIKDSK